MTSKIHLGVLAVFLASGTAAQAQDASAWAGPYVGLQAGIGNGSQDYGGGTTYDIEGNGYGVFGGYMMATGAWAYGVELSYAKTDYSEVDGTDEFPDYNFNHTFDVKMRGGYAVNQALIYGVLGYGWSEWEEGDPTDTYDVDGLLVGLGADMIVSDSVFLGAEILQRGMDGDYPFEADVTTFGLRLGMTF
ncbi:porin family protein [Rhodobacter sp. Har01]|uniref:porin family protein n=1 Tax=Rhodobacter sp. Har01 TaxID=2883999 RepID=UPI001D0979EA|nr:porin family protein [Rhodobacter sp. Har01]MCB6176661.1 porin family protein [Rhodobacter sp. Har01]